MNVQQYLEQSGRECAVLSHPATFTAQQTAQAVHVPGGEMAKTVILKVDGRYVMAVLPATHRIDPVRVREAFDADRVELADEGEFAELFPDCELGALPPFGSQYGMPTMVDAALTHDEQIVIEGNTLRQAIRMNYRDYEDLEHPRVAEISELN